MVQLCQKCFEMIAVSEHVWGKKRISADVGCGLVCCTVVRPKYRGVCNENRNIFAEVIKLAKE